MYVARNALVHEVCARHNIADYDGFSRLLRKMSGFKADRGDLIDAIGVNNDDTDIETVPEVKWRDGYPVDIDKVYCARLHF